MSASCFSFKYDSSSSEKSSPTISRSQILRYVSFWKFSKDSGLRSLHTVRIVNHDRGRMYDRYFGQIKNPWSGTFENFPHFHQNISSNYLKYLQMKVFHLHLYQDTKNSFIDHKLLVNFKSAPLIGCKDNRISINLYLRQYFYLENIWNIKIFERGSSPCSSNIKKIAKSKAICLVAIVYCEERFEQLWSW